MEHQKILNLINEATESKFLTWKWKNFSNNSKANYGAGNEITYNAGILKSSLYN